MISDNELEKFYQEWGKECVANSSDRLKNHIPRSPFLETYIAGYRKCEAMNSQNEIRLLRKIENLIIENEKLRDRLFGGGK